MMNRIEVMDNEIELVAGGNYGDASKDNGAQPRYKVGDNVEVYTTPLHISTKSDKIIRVKKLEGIPLISDRWMYFTEYGEIVSADHIES